MSNYQEFVKQGKKVEELFVQCMNSRNVQFASQHEDMHQHWDVMIDGMKYDVKGMKKINRHDEDVTDLYHFVELRNVHGEKGWLYGDADYFAFETRLDFLLVSKYKLQAYIHKHTINPESINPHKVPFHNYSRKANFGRDDLMTLVPVIDLLQLSERQITKK